MQARLKLFAWSTFALLTACGSSPPAPASPAPSAGPAVSAPPASAAATSTPTPASPAAGAAPAAAGVPGLPPNLSAAMARVLGLMANPGDTATMQTTFSPKFLAAFPPDKLGDVLTSIKAQAGACKDLTPIEVKEDRAAVFTLKCERAALRGTVLVGADPPHLIEALLFKPGP